MAEQIGAIMAKPGPRRRVLVVDDEENIRELLQVSLKFQGNDGDGGQRPSAIDACRTFAPDVLILTMMPGWTDSVAIARRRVEAPARSVGAGHETTRSTVLPSAATTTSPNRSAWKRSSRESKCCCAVPESPSRASHLASPFADIASTTRRMRWKVGELVSLSPTEFTLLRYFMVNAGTVLSAAHPRPRGELRLGGEVNVVESWRVTLRRKLDNGDKRLHPHSARCRVCDAGAERLMAASATDSPRLRRFIMYHCVFRFVALTLVLVMAGGWCRDSRSPGRCART